MTRNFRKRKKKLHGIYLNLSKNGITTTVGPRNTDLEKNSTHHNTGIPQTKVYPQPKNRNNQSIKSISNFPPNTIPTSKNLKELKWHIEEAMQERELLENEIKNQQSLTQKLEKKLKYRQSGIGKIFTQIFISKEAVENLQEEVKEANEYLTNLYNQYGDSQANILIESDKDIQEQYQKVKDAYVELLKSNKIWDIVSEKRNQNPTAPAKTLIDRKEIHFTFEDIDFILSEHSAFHLENANGDNLYIYPAFILLLNHSGAINLIDLQDLYFRFHKLRFIEDNSPTLPSDTEIVDYHWIQVYEDRYPMPIVEYGVLEFLTSTGLREVYHISNVLLAERFANEFNRYLSLLTSPEKQSKKLENIGKTFHGSPSANSKFSYEYYTLLKDLSVDAKRTTKKLTENQPLIDKFGISLLEAKALIPALILYELCQILYIVKQNEIPQTSLEAIGLLLITDQILLYQGKDFLNEEFSNLIELFEIEEFKKAVTNVLELRKSPPIETKLSSGDSELIWTNEITKNLSLLLILKNQEDALFDEYCQFLYHFANIMAKADGKVSQKEESLLKEIYQAIQDPLPKTGNETKIISNSNETLDEVLHELNSLIGLDEVKSEINTLINFIKVQKVREGTGLKSSSLSYHIVFTGNPGTGKTTVARIVAKIYKHLGILTEGQLVETDRSGLVAEYTGQTAVKVNRTVNSALNGVLFIDEAYSLVGENKDDYGKEAVATLIKRMEDDRDKLVVILAGYTHEMTTFIDTNPGVKSRFNRYITFPDYTPSELFEIFESMCRKLDYHLTEEAKTMLKLAFENAYATRDKSFGNGRFVRNIFEKTLEKHANRIAQKDKLTKEILTTITDEDIP